MYYTSKKTKPKPWDKLTSYIKKIKLNINIKELKNCVEKLNDEKSLIIIKKLNALMQKHLDNKKLSQKEIKDLKKEITKAYGFDQEKPIIEHKKCCDRFLGIGCTSMGLIMLLMSVGSGGTAAYSLINDLLNFNTTTNGTTSNYNDYPELLTGSLFMMTCASFMMTCASFFLSTLFCSIGAQRIYRLSTNSYGRLYSIPEHFYYSDDNNSSDEEKQQTENAAPKLLLKLLNNLYKKNSDNIFKQNLFSNLLKTTPKENSNQVTIEINQEELTEKSPLIPKQKY